jgi:hypothetical protein
LAGAWRRRPLRGGVDVRAVAAETDGVVAAGPIVALGDRGGGARPRRKGRWRTDVPTSGGGDDGCPKRGDVWRRRMWRRRVPQAVTSGGGGCPSGAAMTADLGTRERKSECDVGMRGQTRGSCRARHGRVPAGLSPLTSVGHPIANES